MSGVSEVNNEADEANEANENSSAERTDFIREAIREDLAKNEYPKGIITRFPPEPNGFLHIGHAKAICIDFGIAEDFDGRCHLRFDDTNPSKEEEVYAEAIKEDVRWLGFDWGEHLYYASDFFDRMYELAEEMIKAGKAYVCDLSPEEIREYRGTLNEPGRESPDRERSPEENLGLFQRMQAGEFANGTRTLRAKIDMASPNLNLRDPVMYRVLKVPHQRQGDTWNIYPMYDWAHGLEDSFEGVTHSLCSLEFEDHRPLYNWFLEQLPVHHPRQIEFARLNLSYTVTSKRKLQRLVEEKHVDGWDDPRMPTLAGMRRRGFSPEGIRVFTDRIGVGKTNSVVDYALLEHCQREVLNKEADRYMTVLNPVRLIVDNYPEGECEYFEAENNPEDPSAGKREVPFTRELFIEREDFREDPPRKFFRMAPGREVRLKHAYYVTCTGVEKDDAGEITTLHCTYDPASRGGGTEDGRKVKGTLHWVSAEHALKAEVRQYDRLFTREDPGNVKEGEDFTDFINPDSLEVLSPCYAEPALADLQPGETCQFLRKGYFCRDIDNDTTPLVFNRTVTLRDTWARIQRSQTDTGSRGNKENKKSKKNK